MRSNVRALLLASVLVSLGGCATVQQWLQVSPLPVTSQSAQQKTALSRSGGIGQLDVSWPQTNSKRALVNNRATFIGYQGQGQLLLELGTAHRLTLSINGKVLQLAPDAALGQHLVFDISSVTRNGINQLAMLDIKPLGASVRLVLPYPSLDDGTPEQAGFS
ncbi:MAG TPA: penicillin binding protein PBP4B, partial [Rheinheimera sp.]|nr:penicillin binding protein PBP4B [Rheinheimera sp.]